MLGYWDCCGLGFKTEGGRKQPKTEPMGHGAWSTSSPTRATVRTPLGVQAAATQTGAGQQLGVGEPRAEALKTQG